MPGVSPVPMLSKAGSQKTESIINPPLPCLADSILQIRTGKISAIHGTSIQSGINKHPTDGPIKVSTLGLPGDEHQFRPGDLDKALLQYCSQHYAFWKAKQPRSAHRFEAGGFGENLVCTGSMDESNVCIGDVFSVGPSVLVQVSEPRGPCFKLNHRFEVKNMSRLSQETGRTGWYYRIIREGIIQPGDQMMLRERKHPAWTIRNVQKYLYKDMKNGKALRELVEVQSLGKETRNIFLNRLKKNAVESHRDRLGEERAAHKWRMYNIVSKIWETPRVCSFVLEAMESEKVQQVEPGSHVRLKFKNGRYQRAYSVVCGNSNRFELGVALEANSSGGSKYLHEVTKVGDVVSVGPVTVSFPLAMVADHHILIAGGIGITAFVAATQKMEATGESYELHLAVRAADEVPFMRHLEPLGEKVTIYDKSAGQTLDIKEVISRANDNTHVYSCGPQRMMDAVTSAAQTFGLAMDHLHFEAFAVDTSGDPFTVELAISGEELYVSAEKTLLDVLRDDAGLDIVSSCEVGSCGTCLVNVKSGQIQHRGIGLMDLEDASSMLSCVSRGVGRIILDL